jgi:integrase
LVHGGGRDGAPLAPGRVTRIHGVLHRAFAQAVRWEWVWFNPVSNASPPRVPPPEVRPPTIDAVVALLHSVRGKDPCLFTYLQLAASTGARRSQLLGLRWGEIGFAQRSIGFTAQCCAQPRLTVRTAWRSTTARSQSSSATGAKP